MVSCPNLIAIYLPSSLNGVGPIIVHLNTAHTNVVVSHVLYDAGPPSPDAGPVSHQRA